MAVYNIYHKDGSRLKDSNGKGITVNSIEYNGTWMGECFVTVTFENEAPISFSIGDYIEYRGERFEINYDPGKIKCASKDSYGGAFKYDSVKFNALSDELVRCDMLDLVLYDNNLHYTALPQFAFYVESLDDLLDRIQANLDELYGKASWKLYSRNKERSVQRGGLESEWNSIYGDGTADNVIDSTSISISDQTCWDALSLVNSQFDVNFIIRNRNVYVGTAGMPTTNIFKYGKDKGLYEIEQNSESDQAIVTRLRAYGSNRNLPNHYYADLGGIPFLNITGDYHEGSTDNGLSVMMEDSTYAGMFTDIISDNGSNIKHCRIRGSIGGYEFGGTLELVKKDSLKSTTRLLAEGKEVCDAIKAKIDLGIVEVDFISGANKSKFDGNRINYVSNLPNNMACDRLMLPGFPNKTLKEWWDAQTEEKKAWLNPSGKEHIFSNEIYRPYVDSLNIEKIGVRPSSVFFDQDDKVNGIVEIYPTIEEMEVDGVRIDEIYTGTNIEDDGRFGDGETVANVDIYLSPKINFDIRGLMQDDFTIHMKDGMCAGREFKIAGCTKQNDGSWRLTIERKPDDSLNLYFPYNDFQIKKGDHFVLSGIELPDAYVEAASEKLLKYCIAYLDKNDYTRYVYQPKIDEIFMARQHDTAMADASGLTKSLYLTLKEGDIMLFKDDDLGIDAEITIDQLTIKEEDGKIPTYEITLREEKEVGTIQKIQNQISSIVSGNGGAGTTGGGLSTTQIKNLIDSVGSDRFLSKLNPDTARGIITFLQGTNWGSFTSETGAAMTVDPSTGQTYMEVDRLKVRLKAFFELLEVQKVGYVGGKIVVSKGQGVDILDVEEIYDSEGNLSAYRCYFLGEQEGRRINNLLRVNDQMICKDDNISEGSTDGATNKYYWRLATAVSSDVVKRGNNVCHWVDLSATDYDTISDDVPEIGDTICQLGNRTDVDRQGAEVLSVVDANSPSFTIYAGINSYSLVNKEYIDMGVINGKAYCNIYGSTYIGDRERKTGYLRWNDDTKTFEIKGTIDISSPLSSGGTIGGAIDNAADAYKGEFDAFTTNINNIVEGFQAQIDGVIETWFYEPEPTLGNEPAVNWTDNATKDKHLGDLYYSKEGKAYRFQKDGDNYVWQIITDTDIAKALEEAKKANDAANAAQGTADSKMRVFVVQPTADDEYSVGDMWVNATYPADGTTYKDDILKCKTPKSKGAAFSINHWEKASKYTDDAKANEALTKVGDLQTDVTELGESFNTLTNTTLPALSDGIITTSEKENIRQALMQVQKECVDVINAYTNLTVNYKSIYDKIAADVRANFATAYTQLMGSATLSSDGTITYTSGQGGAYGALVDNINTLLNKEGNLTTNEIATINNNIANFNIKYNDFQNRLVVVRNDIEKTLDTRITDVDEQLGGYAYLKKIVGGKTTIDGGLVLTTMLGTGYEVTSGAYQIMSGISGLYETAKSVAIWAGGSMIDKFVYYDAENKKFNVPDDVNPANFLVRMDGTGYAAGGNFWWDNDGKIHADPQSFLINEQYVGNVMQLFQLHYKVADDTAFTNVDYVTPTRMFNGLELSDLGLKIGDTAKLYIKDGVLFLDGDLAVTGGITMYASDGVKSGMIDQVYAILDSSKFEIENGVITIKGDIGDGKVKGATLGGVAVTLNANGILEFDAYPTTLPASDVYAWAKAATKPSYSWGEITDKPSSFTPSAHTHDDRYYTESEVDTKLDLKLDTSLKGAADGLATLDSSGKVPSSQLPSYVDDVLEYTNKASFPSTGESGKIYIDKATNLTYRWGGTAYVEISQSLALGETSSTAYAGDKGKKNAEDIAALQTGKADKATTLSGYGITDAYTKTEVNTKLTDGSVTKVGTEDVGSVTLPIYLKAGVPTACNTTLGVSITGNSATATKLKTSITLWGQPFDGSANVSGSLTNVGTITPTGEDLKVVGNLIVTGGITMYATDGVASGLMEQILVDGTTIGKKADGTLYAINTGNVRSIIMGSTTYTPNDSGAVTLPEKVTWANIEGKPSTFTPSEHTHAISEITNISSASVSYASSSGYANGIANKGTLDSQEKIDNFITASRFQYASFKGSNNLGFVGNDGMILSMPWGSSVNYGVQMAFDDTTSATVKVRGKDNSWGSWYTLLHSGNYNDYAPTKTGTGASGTWGINISGNAATATSAGNADTVDGEHSSAFAHIGAHNNLMADDNEFTFAPSGFSGTVYINWRTAGGFNGNITDYKLCNGAKASLGTIIHSGNIGSYNAGSATKLTSSAGSATLPIYFSDGKPVACTASSVFSNLSNSGNNISVTVAGQNRTLTVGYASNADKVDGWHLGEFHKSAYVTSATGGLSSYWGKLWDITIKTWQYNDMDMTLLLHSAYNSRYSIVNVKLRQNGANSSGAYNFSATLHILTGNIASSDMRLYYNNSTGACSLWVNCWEQYGVVNCKVLSYTSRTNTESKPAGTFYTTTFSSAQTLPSSSYVNGTLVGNVANSDTCDGLHVHGGRNNEANKIVRTDGNGFLQCGYINSSNGNEGNNSSPARVWGTNGSDSFMRTYLTSALSVKYAASAGNADTVDGKHSSAFAHIGARNNLMTSNEFTFASSGFSGAIYFNYRTAGNDGNITEYVFGNGAGGVLGTAIHSGNYNDYAPTKTGTGASGTWGISVSGNAATASKWKTARKITLTGSVTGSVSIDGSGNVSLATTTNHTHSYLPLSGGTITGELYISGHLLTIGTRGQSNNPNRAELHLVSNSNNPCDLWLGSNSGEKWSITSRDSSEGYVLGLYCNIDGVYKMYVNPNGNICIGSNSSPSYKLQVDGSFYSSSVKTGLYVNIGNNNLSTYDSNRAEIDFVTSTDNVAEMWFGVANTRKWALCCRNSSENYKFTLYNPQMGYAMVIDTSSNLLVAGGITMYSDLRKKNILSDEVLSVKEIAAAPLFRHTYKSDDNQYIHVGTSAQYWSGIHEDWFTRKDGEGYYQMELQNLGVAMGISLAREIVKYESKTDKKIRLMKKKINDLEARIKELEGSKEERRTA